MVIKIIRLPLKINYRRLMPIMFLALATLFFISPAIIKQGYYAPIDTIRLYGLLANGTEPHNVVLTDVPVQFLPWLKHAKKLLQNWQFPLWNPYSGGGLPLFANMQSAVLYPLSALFYFLNLKLALVLSSFLKLFAIGLFTYLYLRALKMAPIVAAIGGMAFMFAGFNIVWLSWPHTNVVFLLPAGLWLLEKYFQKQQAQYVLYLSLALVLGLFGGHPETFFYILLVLVLYSLGKLISRKLSWRQKFKVGATLAGGGLLGAGLMAVLLLPFFEYLRLSQTWIMRGGPNNFFLPKLSAILNIIPDLFGNPALGIWFAHSTIYNYIEWVMGYTGVSFVLLAFIAIIRFYKQRLIKFYALLLLFGLAVVYRLPGVFDFITSLPIFSRAANHRLLLIVSFCLMMLGSCALNGIYQKIILFGNKARVVAAIFIIIVTILFIWQMRQLPPALGETALAWQLIFFILFLVNVIVLLIVLENRRWRGFVFIFALLVFLETGGHGMFYNTVTKPVDFYPLPPTVAYLQKQSHYDRAFFYDWLFPPNLGTWYKINEVLDYDAMGLPGWEKFKGALNPFVYANNPAPDANAVLAGLPILRFIGAKFLVFPRDLGKEILKKSSERLGLVYEDERAVILSQPALPRAYLLPTADNDEARGILSQLKEDINARPWQPVRSLSLQENGNSTITYNSPSPAYLVLNENYYPGWQATIDNGPTVKIEDGLELKLIKVPAGEHTVKIVYWPKSFRLGLTISAASLGVWLALFLLLRRKRLPTPAGEN